MEAFPQPHDRQRPCACRHMALLSSIHSSNPDICPPLCLLMLTSHCDKTLGWKACMLLRSTLSGNDALPRWETEDVCNHPISRLLILSTQILALSPSGQRSTGILQRNSAILSLQGFSIYRTFAFLLPKILLLLPQHFVNLLVPGMISASLQS